jgi:hypothetical protein
MPVPDHPFFVKLGGLLIAQFGSDFAEGFGRTGGLGKGNGDGFGG